MDRALRGNSWDIIGILHLLPHRHLLLPTPAHSLNKQTLMQLHRWLMRIRPLWLPFLPRSRMTVPTSRGLIIRHPQPPCDPHPPRPRTQINQPTRKVTRSLAPIAPSLTPIPTRVRPQIHSTERNQTKYLISRCSRFLGCHFRSLCLF